jgi:hypothetical protein
MAVLTNPRRERFARLVAQGKSAMEAYELAGYKPDCGAASRLSKIVKERILELTEKIVRATVTRSALTRADIIDELATIATAPIGHEHIKTIDKRGALMDIAKLEGWVIERREVGQPGTFEELTDEQVEQLWRERMAQIAEALTDPHSIDDLQAKLLGRSS